MSNQINKQIRHSNLYSFYYKKTFFKILLNTCISGKHGAENSPFLMFSAYISFGYKPILTMFFYSRSIGIHNLKNKISVIIGFIQLAIQCNIYFFFLYKHQMLGYYKRHIIPFDVTIEQDKIIQVKCYFKYKQNNIMIISGFHIIKDGHIRKENFKIVFRWWEGVGRLMS